MKGKLKIKPLEGFRGFRSVNWCEVNQFMVEARLRKSNFIKGLKLIESFIQTGKF